MPGRPDAAGGHGHWCGPAEARPGASSGPVSPALAALQVAAGAVVAQPPAELPEGQALADAAALLTVVEQLRCAVLRRLADVDARKLYLLDGASSTSSWVDRQQTSLDRGELALARRLSTLPTLEDAVRSGRISIAAAERVGKSLAKLRRHVDRPDGLIDGQDGEQALLGVIGNGVPSLVVQALGGLAPDDPRLDLLVAQLVDIVERPVSQLARLEAAFVLLAQWVEPVVLPGALGQLVDALLPNELEQRAEDGHADRALTVVRKSDGSGWRITEGELDLECGELLQAFLAAERAVDPDGPLDTAGFEQLRTDGWQSGDDLPEFGSPGPRSLRQQRHDALRNGLRRYLDAGVAGVRDKVAPHIAVTVGLDLLEQQPGSLPAMSQTTGVRLPASLVRRWLCDSALARFVLHLGGRVVETSHTERTLKAHERRIKKVETGNRCQIAGCRCGPGSRLVPHHPDAFARTGRTSLGDTAWICQQHHHDLHLGKRRLRLRDGRWLDEDGWADGPPVRYRQRT